MIERRESTRHALQMQTLILQEGIERPFNLLRANIGFGGLGGYCGSLVPTDAALSVQIDFPQRSGALQSEMVKGKVIWSHRDGNFNAFGLAFAALSKKDHPLLFSYLQYAAQFE